MRIRSNSLQKKTAVFLPQLGAGTRFLMYPVPQPSSSDIVCSCSDERNHRGSLLFQLCSLGATLSRQVRWISVSQSFRTMPPSLRRFKSRLPFHS